MDPALRTRRVSPKPARERRTDIEPLYFRTEPARHGGARAARLRTPSDRSERALDRVARALRGILRLRDRRANRASGNVRRRSSAAACSGASDRLPHHRRRSRRGHRQLAILLHGFLAARTRTIRRTQSWNEQPILSRWVGSVVPVPWRTIRDLRHSRTERRIRERARRRLARRDDIVFREAQASFGARVRELQAR